MFASTVASISDPTINQPLLPRLDAGVSSAVRGPP
jgi:hypothetical protein